MKCNIVFLENDKSWRSYAQEMLDSCRLMVETNQDPSMRRTIGMNQTRGGYMPRSENSSYNVRTILFLINRSTEFMGGYLDSDFTIIKFDIQLKTEDRESKSEDEDMALIGKPKEVYRQYLEIVEEVKEL